MINIIEICNKHGIEVPEDKQKSLTKDVLENYVAISEHNKRLKQAEDDRDKWKVQAETSEETLKKFEGIDPDKIKDEIDDWKKKVEDTEENYKKQLAERDYDDALNAELNNYKFSSAHAKKSIIAAIKEKKLPLENGKIIGLSDMMEDIQKNDSGAFETEELDGDSNVDNKAKFTSSKSNNRSNKKTMTKEEILNITDRVERQKAIADNIDLFQ